MLIDHRRDAVDSRPVSYLICLKKGVVDLFYIEKTADQEHVSSVGAESSTRVDLYAVVGLGTAYAMATSLAFGVIEPLNQFALHPMIFYAFLAIVYFVARFPAVSRVAARKHYGEAAAAASFLPLALLELGIECPADFAIVFSLFICALSGFLGGLYLLSHFRLLECGPKDASPRTVVASYVFCLLICLLGIVLQGQMDMIFFCILPILCAGSLVLRLRRDRPPRQHKSPSRRASAELSVKTHAMLFMYMCVFGFCLSATSTSLNTTVAIACIVLSIALAAWFEKLNRRFLRTLGETAVIFLPLCIFCLFATCSPNPQWTRVSLVAGSVALIYQGIRNQTFLVRLSSFLGTSAAADIAQGRFPPLAGTATGFALGFAHAQLAEGGGQAAILAMPAALSIAVVTVYTLMPFNRGTPVKGGLLLDPEEEVVPWKPSDVHELDIFDNMCRKIASGRNLTPRENEVFRLLACGYNTESIANILVVSSSTVKTHVARIYRKLGIHSQQEIISMIHEGK